MLQLRHRRFQSLHAGRPFPSGKRTQTGYPAIFDTIDQEDFDKSKKPVRLYVRNLSTGHQQQIAKSVARPFRPKWSGDRALSYDKPNGKGRTSVTVR